MAGYAQGGTTSKQFEHVFTRNSQTGAKIEAEWNLEPRKKALGEGSYGVCVKAYHVKDTEKKNPRCVKEIEKKKVKDKARFQKELQIQEDLDHPNIVKVYETYEDAKNYYLVMEMCAGGELFDRIIEASETSDCEMAFNEEKASTYMQQIFGAMQYLHSRHYAHRDIKPENFLMSSPKEEAHIKVIDFGLAAKFTPGVPMTTKAGTPYYVAPQVLQGSYDEKCDVWSCGCILYILLSGVPPFYGETDPQILAAVKKGRFDYPSPEWDNISPQAKAIINNMLTMDPAKRCSFTKLIDDQWLTDHAEKKQGKLHNNLNQNLSKFSKANRFKKLALTCIAKQLSDTDIAELRQTFELLDKNNDGQLTLEEIKQGMEEKGMTVPESLAAIDTDGSGQIDYTEFIAATIEKATYEKEATLWAAFRTLDLDGDGQIDKAELMKALGGESNEAGVLEALQQMMDEADVNKDGKISFDEFKKCVGVDSAAITSGGYSNDAPPVPKP